MRGRPERRRRARDRRERPAPWADTIPPRAWQDAVDVLDGAARSGATILSTCHVEPDGDALGSLLALHRVLASRGAAVQSSWGSVPFQVPPQYTFLPGLRSLTPPERVVERPDVMVVLDAGTRARLGILSGRVDVAGTVLVIDHHASTAMAAGGPGRPLGDVRLVAPGAAATVVLVEELIRRMGVTLDRDLATCLYVGLVTDTGRFQNPNTDRTAMELGTRLIEQGIRHDELSRQIFDTHSFGFLKVQARVLDRARFDPAASLVSSWVSDDDLEQLGVALEETEGLIDVLRTVESAEVAMIAKELPSGDWKVSLRSKGTIDVGALAASLGGGGHTFAAGFTASGAIDDVVDRLVAELDGALAITTEAR